MIRVAPETIAVARRLYEDKTLPVREVARKAGIDPKTLYVYAKREGWSARSDRMVPSDIRPLEWAGRRCTGSGALAGGAVGRDAGADVKGFEPH